MSCLHTLTCQDDDGGDEDQCDDSITARVALPMEVFGTVLYLSKVKNVSFQSMDIAIIRKKRAMT